MTDFIFYDSIIIMLVKWMLMRVGCLGLGFVRLFIWGELLCFISLCIFKEFECVYVLFICSLSYYY